jgi:hypothetical protein
MISYITTRADGSVSYLGTGDDDAFRAAVNATWAAGYILVIVPSPAGTIAFHETLPTGNQVVPTNRFSVTA